MGKRDFEHDAEEDDEEPCGSCEICGTNLYIDDDLDLMLCDQCCWRVSQTGD